MAVFTRVVVKPYEPSGLVAHDCCSIATPPGWDASPSQVTPSILPGFSDSLLEPIYTSGWRGAL